MTNEENIRLVECGNDRFEIIKRARKHIIDATNIESSPEEMKVLDDFLFRCWQMGWLKNDFHQLEKENEGLKKENKISEEIIIGEQQEINRLEKELEKEQALNSVIKQRLVEVNCDCNKEKKQTCPMFPEYCEGEHKTVVDLLTLVSDGLNETLLKQKDDEISQLKEKIFNLENKQADVVTSLSN